MQIRIASLGLYGKWRMRMHMHTICINVVDKLIINPLPCLTFVVNNAQETRKSQDASESPNLGKITADKLIQRRLLHHALLILLRSLQKQALRQHL